MSGSSSTANKSLPKKSDEFPDLLEELLHSGIAPNKTVGCVEAFLAFSERGCFICLRHGIEDTYFICDRPNCAAKNWYCHDCVVKQTTGNRETYSEGCPCVNCRKVLEFEENSVKECENLERELVESAFESLGGNHKQSAGGNNNKHGSKVSDAGYYKASSALKRSSKEQLLRKLTTIILDPKTPSSFDWFYHDSSKYLPYFFSNKKEDQEKLKIEIDNQLKDLSAEQLFEEIIRYEEFMSLLEKLIYIVTKDEKEEISFKWTYYDPNKLHELVTDKKYLQKQSIEYQLEDRSLAQLKLEIARYMYAKKKNIRDPFDEIVGVTARDVHGKTIFTDDQKKIKKDTVNKLLYRLPLGPLEELRRKLDRKTFIEKQAWLLQSQMVGRSSCGAGSSSSGGSSSSSISDNTAMTVVAKITEIEELKSKNNEMEETIAQLKTEIDSERNEKEKEKKEAAENINTLTKENMKKTKQNKTLEGKISSLEQEHEEWERTNAALHSKIDENNSFIFELQSQLQRYQSDSDTRDTKVEAYEKDATTHKSLYLQEKAKVDCMQEKLKAIEEKYNETEKKLISTRNQYTALETKNIALESKNAGLERTIDLLKAEMIGSDSPLLLGSSSPVFAPPTPRLVFRESEFDDRKQVKSSAAASMRKKKKAKQKRQKNRLKERQQRRQQEQEEEEDNDHDADNDNNEFDEAEEVQVSWEKKCAEVPGWTPNHEHVGKQVARYFPCNDKGQKGQEKLYLGEVVRYIPSGDEDDESFMVYYKDGDSEEYGLQELLGMIKLFLGPAAVAEKEITKTVPGEVNSDDPTQKRIKKRQRSDSNLSDDDNEGDKTKKISDELLLKCYEESTLLRRFLLMIDGRQHHDPDDRESQVKRRLDEYSAKLDDMLGVTADGKYPHLPEYRIAKSNGGNGSK